METRRAVLRKLRVEESKSVRWHTLEDEVVSRAETENSIAVLRSQLVE
jgi:hypothetical protein